ncbi:MAG: hypothetical protein K2X44_13105, partial [Magnetospirillum sp.]|nr:hypothetical protein [Magnetospirillum sp.]
MTGGADRIAADGPSARGFGIRPNRHIGTMPWLMALSGIALSLVFALVAREVDQTAAMAAAKAGIDLPWQPGLLFVAALAASLAATATAVVIIYRFGASIPSQDEHLTNLASALARMEANPLSPWRALNDGHIVDGYALWDAEDRLADQSGFLGRYLPQLAEWRTPTARQIITALVDTGQLALFPGTDRQQTIETLCQLRMKTPGLRAFR